MTSECDVVIYRMALLFQYQLNVDFHPSSMYTKWCTLGATEYFQGGKYDCKPFDCKHNCLIY